MERAAPATKVRFAVVAVCTVMAVMLYIDRFFIGIAAEFIREDLGLDSQRNFVSAFFWAYALAQVPSGWLSDRYGARLMLTIYIVSWSIFTLLFGVAGSFWMLWSMRFLMGIAQAGAYPTAGALINRWFGASHRGKASSIVAFGGRVGGAAVQSLTAWLLLTLTQPGPFTVGENDLLLPDSLQQQLTAAATDQPSLVAGTEAERWRANLRHEVSLAILGPMPPAAEAQDAPLLLQRMNAWIIEGSPNAQHPPADALMKETLRALDHVQSGNKVTRQRANRMLLEDLFPKHIRQLYGTRWRDVLWIYGLAGILTGVVFWLIARDSPTSHPWANQAERALIAADQPVQASDAGERVPVPLIPMLRNRSLWCNCWMQFTTNIGWLFVLDQLAPYLFKVHKLPLSDTGNLVFAAAFMGILGTLLGGVACDFSTRRLGTRWGRRLPMLVTRFAAAGGFLVCAALGWSGTAEAWLFVAAVGFATFASDSGNPATWAYAQDVGGRHVGSALGWANMWGNFGAAVGPHVYARVLGKEPGVQDWNVLFLVCAAAFVLSGLFSLGVDATSQIAKEPEVPEMPVARG